jgi:signal transduction histidine kinase
LYELAPLGPQLQPPRFLSVSYSILMAAATFQGLRFLNRLAIELNTTYVSEEVTQQVTERSQQFLARVSHELRTPLNSVLGFAKMLRRADLPETQAAYLTQIVEEGEQLNRLVSDLLDSAQLSAGALILKKEPCDVNQLCSAVAEEVQPMLRPGVALNVALSPDLPPMEADGLRLRQVIRNLVGNAAKYTPRGQITLTTARHGAWIQVAVSDTGPGIPEEQRALVFVPFVKLDGRSAGVGLGLDIARQLARLHGGDIRLESVVGQGSTFMLEIPAQVAGGTAVR